MKKIIQIFIVVLLPLFLNAQWVQTQVKAKDVVKIFSTEKVEWNFPIAENQSVKLVWEHRENSFKDFKTFIGNNKMVQSAVLSVYQNKAINGKLHWQGKEFEIKTNENGFLEIHSKEEEKGQCGVCQSDFHIGLPKSSSEKFPLSRFQKEETDGASDDVLRIYRLALPVANRYFREYFQSDMQRVKAFWANTETYLNQMYVRDLSIKFKVIDDEKLVIQTENDPFLKPEYNREAQSIVRNSTQTLDSIFSKENYDIGMVITTNSRRGVLGIAGVGSGYVTSGKATGLAIASATTIAHELGHMFGANHTHSVNVDDSLESEPGGGQSVMSYGYPMNFFSMVNVIKQIRSVTSQMPYYSDEARTRKVGRNYGKFYGRDYVAFDNVPYGVKTNNKAPRLDRTKIKTQYIIPKNTFFQFQLSAEDAENHPLSYLAHQSDIKGNRPHIPATFIAQPATASGEIRFQTQYGEVGLDSRESFSNGGDYILPVPNTTPNSVGEFNFLLAVRDSEPNQNRATGYDVEKTKVVIREGTPFVFTNEFKREYRQGETIDLTWSVDNQIFNGTKVRILLSDDFGETFKHILVEETPNDGRHSVTIPEILIGRKSVLPISFIPNGREVPAGVIKIEVIDQIAYAVSHTRPYSIFQGQGGSFQGEALGGFQVLPSDIEFQNLPEKEVSVSCQEIASLPPSNSVTATSSCVTGEAKISFREEGKLSDCQQYTYKRIWVATDGCGGSKTYEQIVNVVPPSELVFANPPQDIEVSCGQIPSAETTLQVRGCDRVQITHTDEVQGQSCGYTIVRTYRAEGCSKVKEHRQIIRVTDTQSPEFQGVLPIDISVEEGKIPTQEDITASDECSENVQVTKTRTQNTDGTFTDVWTATDPCGNQKTHRRTIRIVQKTPPPAVDIPSSENENKVENEKEPFVYNWVSVTTNNYYLKIDFLEGKQASLKVFNEMGHLVFYQPNYNNDLNAFRGINNIKNEKLLSGTYFYVLEYNDKSENKRIKTGFLQLVN